jgi:hypothetical protein
MVGISKNFGMAKVLKLPPNENLLAVEALLKSDGILVRV